MIMMMMMMMRRRRRRIIFDYHMRRLTAYEMVNETGVRNGCVQKVTPQLWFVTIIVVKISANLNYH